MGSATGAVQELPMDIKAIQDHMAVQALVRSYQVRTPAFVLSSFIRFTADRHMIARQF